MGTYPGHCLTGFVAFIKLLIQHGVFYLYAIIKLQR